MLRSSARALGTRGLRQEALAIHRARQALGLSPVPRRAATSSAPLAGGAMPADAPAVSAGPAAGSAAPEARGAAGETVERLVRLRGRRRAEAVQAQTALLNDHWALGARIPRGDDFTPEELAAERTRRQNLIAAQLAWEEEDAAWERFVNAWLTERLLQYDADAVRRAADRLGLAAPKEGDAAAATATAAAPGQFVLDFSLTNNAGLDDSIPAGASVPRRILDPPKDALPAPALTEDHVPVVLGLNPFLERVALAGGPSAGIVANASATAVAASAGGGSPATESPVDALLRLASETSTVASATATRSGSSASSSSSSSSSSATSSSASGDSSAATLKQLMESDAPDLELMRAVWRRETGRKAPADLDALYEPVRPTGGAASSAWYERDSRWLVRSAFQDRFQGARQDTRASMALFLEREFGALDPATSLPLDATAPLRRHTANSPILRLDAEARAAGRDDSFVRGPWRAAERLQPHLHEMLDRFIRGRSLDGTAALRQQVDAAERSRAGSSSSSSSSSPSSFPSFAEFMKDRALQQAVMEDLRASGLVPATLRLHEDKAHDVHPLSSLFTPDEVAALDRLVQSSADMERALDGATPSAHQGAKSAAAAESARDARIIADALADALRAWAAGDEEAAAGLRASFLARAEARGLGRDEAEALLDEPVPAGFDTILRNLDAHESRSAAEAAEATAQARSRPWRGAATDPEALAKTLRQGPPAPAASPEAAYDDHMRLAALRRFDGRLRAAFADGVRDGLSDAAASLASASPSSSSVSTSASSSASASASASTSTSASASARPLSVSKPTAPTTEEAAAGKKSAASPTSSSAAATGAAAGAASSFPETGLDYLRTAKELGIEEADDPAQLGMEPEEPDYDSEFEEKKLRVEKYLGKGEGRRQRGLTTPIELAEIEDLRRRKQAEKWVEDEVERGRERLYQDVVDSAIAATERVPHLSRADLDDALDKSLAPTATADGSGNGSGQVPSDVEFDAVDRRHGPDGTLVVPAGAVDHERLAVEKLYPADLVRPAANATGTEGSAATSGSGVLAGSSAPGAILFDDVVSGAAEAMAPTPAPAWDADADPFTERTLRRDPELRLASVPEDIHHSSRYTPYHFRLLEAVHHRAFDALVVLWRYKTHVVDGPAAAPDWLGYNIVLDAAARARQRGFIPEVLEDMFARGAKPSQDIVNLLVKAAVLDGDRAEAERLVREMPRHGFQPDVHSFAALISANMAEGRYTGAYEVFNQMKKAGVKPTEHVFRILLTRLMQDEQPEHLHYVWRTLRLTPTIKPSNKTFCELINAFAKLGSVEDMWDVFTTMREAKHGRQLPDASTLVTVFNELVGTKRFSEARKLRSVFEGAGYFASGEVNREELEAIVETFDDQEEASAILARRRLLAHPDRTYGRPYNPETNDEDVRRRVAERSARKYAEGLVPGAAPRNDLDILAFTEEVEGGGAKDKEKEKGKEAVAAAKEGKDAKKEA